MLSAVIPSAHSYPAMRLAPQPVHQRCVHPGPLVLGTGPRKSHSPTADRDRTVSRRSEPSSRTTLNGEQPYPWDLLQPQDAMSRHRGAKRRRRYGLLGVISLLYLLSVERWPFHAGPPDHYGRLSSLLELSLSQSGGLVPLHFARRGSLRLRLITFFGTPFELALKCADGLPKIGGSVSERRHSVSPSLFVVARRRGAQIVLLLTIPSRASR